MSVLQEAARYCGLGEDGPRGDLSAVLGAVMAGRGFALAVVGDDVTRGVVGKGAVLVVEGFASYSSGPVGEAGSSNGSAVEVAGTVSRAGQRAEVCARTAAAACGRILLWWEAEADRLAKVTLPQ